MTENLKALLSDIAVQQILCKAERRKAIWETMIKNPEILSKLEHALSDVIEKKPRQESSKASESHWTARLHPDWTPEKLEALNPPDLEVLMHTPTLSPDQVEHIAQTT